ncbi:MULTISPECIES: hemagglutinin repeat-containing protein [unclassified Variovorax]|uniref:hemagglutinin repeat-containing protein n=1 Tax=unclassified Variovorax TaxID=663243 RepID=UPI003F484D6F
MNKQLHRVVFNAARGMRVVVQETAKSTGKGASKSTGTGGGALLGVVAALLTAGAVHAQIVGAPNVPGNLRPTVLVAPNGVPLINVQAPSAAGVSRNVYNQFNVGANGAILNNSRANVQTQLGGFVQANPFMAGGAARIIVNEVNGGSPSQLRGYIEVGGQRAEVIIANPAGISVDGGGFINASRATLTTGTPQFNAMGGLDSFLVRGGTVTIDGAGLDFSKTDYAAILARAVQVNAGIWASELKVVAGANQVSADSGQVTPIAGTGAVPAYALDVAALGGMYANKISLIGTEAGLGVRNAGSIGAGAGGLVVTAAGRLENIGTLEGQRVELTTPGDIDNRGGTIRQTSTTGLTIASPVLSNTNGGVIGAEPVSAGTGGTGTSSGGTASTEGTTQPGGSGATTPSSTSGDSSGSGSTSTPATYTPLALGAITAGGTLSNDGGRIYAGGPITLNTPQINNAGGTLNVATMAVTGPNFSNAGGSLNVSNSFSANVGRLDNSGGKLNAGSLNIATSGDLINVDGTLTSATDANLTVGGKANNTRGTVSATGSLTASVGGAIQNTSGTLVSNQNLAVTAQSLNNSQGSISSANGNVRLNVGQQFLNTGGRVASGVTLTIQTGSLDGSKGNLQSTGDMSVTASQALTSTGSNVAGGNATLQGASVDLSTSQTGASNIAINATQGNVTASGATLATPGMLAITANARPGQTLVNNAGVLNAAQLQINVSNIANTAGGQIVQTGTGAMTIVTTGTLNNDGGHIATNSQNLTLQGAAITNTSGKIDHAGPGTLTIAGGSFSGANGQITGNGALAVNLTGAFNQDGGTTYAQQINLSAGSLSNQSGASIVQAGAGTTTLNVGGALSNNGGTIASNGVITASAGSVANQGGKLQAAGASDLNLTVAGQIDNSAGGKILGGGNTTVNAGSLRNDAGSLTAVGNLKATVLGGATNVGGTLAANGNTTIAASSLDNSGGTTAAVSGDLGVTTTGTTTSNAGTLQAGGVTTLSNGGLANKGGKIFGNSLSIETHGNTLDNSAKGTVAATGAVDVRSGALNNDSGLIQSGGALTIDTNGQTLTNTNASGYTNGQGGITSADKLTISAGAMSSSAGFVGAKGALKATTQAFSNTASGQVIGQATVTINTNGASYDNSGSQTQAVGALTVNAGAIQNAGGLLRSSDTTTLNAAATVNNANTSGTNQGIEGTNVTINATNLGNQTGAVRAAQNLTVTAGGTVDNSAGGLLTAGDTVKIVDPSAANPGAKTLSVVNTGGTLTATNSLRIEAAKFSNDGSFTSGRDMSVVLTQDIVNNRDVSVSGNLTYGTTGHLTNNAKLLAGNTLTVNGGLIDNTATGEMSGTNTIVNAGTLNNRGLIDSQGSTQVNAGTLNNIGTGRIYGNAVSIGVGTLVNDAETVGGATTSATIASRGSLDIGASNITNREHALIFSSSNMAIGGALDSNRKAIGQGGTLDNLSADIQSLGDMSISMGQVNNRDVHIQLGAPTVTASVLQGVQPKTLFGSGVGRTSLYLLSEVTLDPANGFVYRLDTGELVGTGGYSLWTNNLTTTTDAAINAAPAHLIAGGNMTVNGQLYNQDSQVLAGGTITASGYQSSQLTGSVTVTGLASAVNNQGQVEIVNVPLFVAPQSIALGAYKYQPNMNAATGYNASNAAKGSSSASGGGAGSASGNANAGTIVEVAANVGTVIGAGGTGAGASGGSSAGGGKTIPTVVRTSTPNLNVPQASLFRTQAAGKYLIETDPRFANYRNWLSSDYLLNSLGFDPNSTLKRLGDGFYEQQLIREQVAMLTGYRYLDGFSDDEDQYAELMNAGATFAKDYGLRPGIALTAAQMAQLTSDIVWLVQQTVTLPDGTTQEVLVPQVYVRVLPGDIDGSGALLSAEATVIKSTGDVTNKGTIAGRSLVLINADNVNNLDGGRMVGGSVGIDARGNINNIGSSITARDAAVLTAGGDINIQTATRSLGGNAAIDRVAGVYVSNPGGVLLASAGRDANLVGAILSNSGESSRTLVKAGRDVNLSTVTESDSIVASGGNARNRFSGVSSKSREVGTSIVGGGSVALVAGNDVNARAAGVSAAGTLAVTAGHDIRIDAGQATESSLSVSNSSRKKLLSSSKSSQTDAHVGTTVIGSSLAGKDVVLSAGNDLTVRGSNVSAQDQLSLSAGRDVRIESAQEQSAGGTVARSSQHGFTGIKDSFLYGQGYNASASNQTEFGASTTQVGSTISGGNVSIDAGRDAQIIASNVLADKNIAVTAGRNIDVLAAQNTSVSTTTSSGYSRSVTPAATGVAPRYTLYANNQGSGNGTGTTSTAVTSLLSANGGNLTMVAGLDPRYKGTGQGNVTTEGADLLAKDKVTVSGNAVNLNAATSSGQSTHSSQSKSHTIGAQLSGTVGSLITSVWDNAQRARSTDDSRLKGALELKAGYDAYKLVTSGSLTTGIQSVTAPGGGADPAGAMFAVSASEQRSSTRSTSADAYTNQRGTNIQAGNIDITARETDINMQGAKLQAKDISLDAVRDINLNAAVNTAMTLGNSSGTSFGGGVTVGLGAQNGISFQGNAGTSKGKSNGFEVHFDNTLVTATDSVKIKSGGDLNMIGAQVAGNSVKADVGGNLNIKTLQDVTTYSSEQSSRGLDLSLCIPPICYGETVTAKVDYASSDVNHNYQSATGQSGIAAGNGGYDLTVKGGTTLVGAAITSTADKDKNSLTTASLVTSDLENKQSTNASHDAVSLSFSSGGYTDANGAVQQGTSALTNAARSVTNTALANLNGGAGLPADNSQSSQTLSVISPGNIKITGTGNKEIDDKSRENVATLTERDPATANGALVNTLTLQQAKEIPRLQQQAQDRQRAAQLVGSVINNVIGDVAAKQGWAEGGTEKIVLHAIAGIIQARVGDGSALTGAVAGALNEALSPQIEKILNSQGIYRYNADGTPNREFSELLIASSTMLGAAVGAATGNAGLGATVANNATVNNRLLHENEKAKIKQLANGDPVLEQQLTDAACYLTHCADGKRDGDPAKAALQETDQAVAANKNDEYTRALALLRNAQTATLFNYTEADQRLDRLNSLDPRNVGGLNAQEQQAKNQNIEACRGVKSCTDDVSVRFDRIVSDRAETTITAINVMKSFDQCAPGDTTCAAGSLVQLQAVRADMKAKGISTDQTDVIGLNSRIARAALAIGDETVFRDIAGAAAIGATASNAGNAGAGGHAVAAAADERKFAEYIFKPGADHGKNVVFESLGYSLEDSQKLTKMWEQQAAEKYASGEFKLGRKDAFGQRIDIEIELPGQGPSEGKKSYLTSGWMILADGSIKLNTPFSGFSRGR